MAITTAVNRRSRGSKKQTRRVAMTASTTIPKGAIVSLDPATGLAINAVSGVSGPVLGIAAETVASAASGTFYVEVECECEFLFTASSITQAMVLEPMLVVDNDTVDETSLNSSVVGMLTEFVSTTSGWVYVPGPSGKAIL